MPSTRVAHPQYVSSPYRVRVITAVPTSFEGFGISGNGSSFVGVASSVNNPPPPGFAYLLGTVHDYVNGTPVAVNNGNEVVGSLLTGSGPSNSGTVPAIFAPSEQTLPLPAGDIGGAAESVNNSGVVVGLAFGASAFQAVRWSNGAANVLSADAVASIVNASGQILGIRFVSSGSNLTVWQPDGSATDYSKIIPGSGTLGAYEFNDAGHIAVEVGAGSWTFYNGQTNATITPLPGDNYVQVFGLDNQDRVYAQSCSTSGGGFPCQHIEIWQNGTATDLQTLVPASVKLMLPSSILLASANGTIVAEAVVTGCGSQALVVQLRPQFAMRLKRRW